MTVLADNILYLKFDSTEVDAEYVDFNPQFSNATTDVTMGSGTAHMQRAAGLNDTKLSIKLGYSIENVQTYIQKIKQGNTVTVEFGLEGNVTGKPRHVQSFIVSSLQTTKNVQKNFVVFDISMDAADAPSVDMQTGAVY